MSTAKPFWKNRWFWILLLGPGGIVTVIIATSFGPFTSSDKTAGNSFNAQVNSNAGSTVSVQQVSGNLFSAQSNSPIMTLNATQASSVINYNYYSAPDSSVGDAIKAFESRLQTNTETIEFTRKEVKLLTQALKDLDERTSGIEKLPDGRTKMGPILSGSQTVVFARLEAARSNFLATNYQAALTDSTNAINAYEESETKTKDIAMSTGGRLTPKGISQMYGIAAESAAQMNNFELAIRFGEKVQAIADSAQVRKFVISHLLRLNRTNDASIAINNAVMKFPDDTQLREIQKLTGLGSTNSSPVKN